MLLVFDDCLLDPDRRELSRASTPVAIAPKVFDLLLYLAEHRERVVSRDDLIGAVWGGRIVSESTLASHINAVRKAVGDDGHQQRVIRTVARKGFRFIADLREAGSAEGTGAPGAGFAATPASPPTLPDKPSIAVLPFVNLSGDPEQDYLADGVVEDIIAALSQYRWLFVVARNSSFTYKGRAVDVKQAGRELGVRYVLEGSWRKADNRVRITGQLIDATTGAHHWAGRFEGVLGDIFALQDQITETVVGAIAPQLERAEIERARHKPTENLGAYDYYLRGMAWLHRGTREAIDHALPLFLKAIEHDPDFASAYAMAAWCHCWRKINGWMTDRPRELAEGVLLARRAVELGKDDAVALTRCGHVLGHLAQDLPGGIALLDKALMLNPNLAAAWFLGAFLKLLHGETEEAVEHFTHAMRLSPLDPELYKMEAGMAAAHLFMGHFDTAASWAERALRELPSLLLAAATLAASHAHAGRSAEAQRALDHLRQLDPALRLANVAEWLPIQRSENLATLIEGLRRAGLPT
ncbi:winged helix-turn-helix domain-containing tetratricopeptide repeat protein [Aromatoleum petrolei]|uniref:CadC-family transcriptional regulator n=1 Tax=Aromatoleum petrolei TaxID=76116 RepID=A0ABX1MNY3_9RHOO|nr:winged helix-turn-helix domain-containing protein [Aromatoleum petrolei]NMF89478.1 CadC-family transcriptional regulator [Aromatoleum petrolei]QTQ36240.1 Transcriptional regulator, OmpR family [Aromatoleum petrolei]